ncbi:MAG TPA: TerY-C metal binding domain-containing protein [Longimicrobium sp.]|nr:TerY-C metal binding domain-containing protein [Longimicrobium sp.]
MEAYERRLPVYLVLDVSESMLDEGIDALQKGLTALVMDLHGDAQALETAWVSVITFADRAEQVVPLTELARLRIPPLRCRPGTALGGALILLAECIRREVRTQSAHVKGDWKPLVFLLTDGMPTDEWEGPAVALRAMTARHPANLVAIGCGEEVDPYVLMQVSGNVMMMRDDPESFRRVFRWISSSVTVTSRAVASPDPGPFSLDKLLEGVAPAPTAAEPRPRGARVPLLFLPFRCQHTHRPYLVRYRLREELDGYEPLRTHRVDEDYLAAADGSDAALGLSSKQVFGVLPCPHCGAEGAGRCPCGGLMCADDGDHVPAPCPWCGRMLQFADDGGGPFSLCGRMG